ncbi:hypothetical protein B0H10DRAFT_1717940, partial [Mycena sp. CBHHK59/15]
DDDGVVHGPKSLSDIELAPTKCMCQFPCILLVFTGADIPQTERGYPKQVAALAARIHQPQLPELLRRFLHEELHGLPDGDTPPVPLDDCPVFEGEIAIHHSAIALFYAPSDLGGAGGMYRERIRSNPNWHG